MNIGIVTSFLIGGLLLLAMLHFNNQVTQHSTEVTIESIEKGHANTLRRIISQDFNRIGFGNGNQITAFVPPYHINFKADIYGQGTREIKWQFKPNKQVNSTTNPDDRVLQRVEAGSGSKPTTFHVVDFQITGYQDNRGTIVTTDKTQIKSLRVKVVYESPEPIPLGTGKETYHKTVWEKLFVPNNLQLN